MSFKITPPLDVLQPRNKDQYGEKVSEIQLTLHPSQPFWKVPSILAHDNHVAQSAQSKKSLPDKQTHIDHR